MDRLEDIELAEMLREGEVVCPSTLTTFSLGFLASAQKEWNMLDSSVQTQFCE